MAKNAEKHSNEKMTRPASQAGAATFSSASIVSALGREGLVEHGAHRVRIDVALDEGAADAAREDEGNLAVAHLLVLAHQRDQIGGTVAEAGGRAYRQTDRREVPAHTHPLLRRAQAEPRRQLEREDAADPHGLAMQQPVGIAD